MVGGVVGQIDTGVVGSKVISEVDGGMFSAEVMPEVVGKIDGDGGKYSRRCCR